MTRLTTKRHTKGIEMRSRFLNQLLSTTFICGAALGVSTPALAQDQQDPNEPPAGPVENSDPGTSATGEEQAPDQDRIMVAGTRIREPNLTSTSPAPLLNSQEVKLSGTTRTEDIVNSLPQAFAGQ